MSVCACRFFNIYSIAHPTPEMLKNLLQDTLVAVWKSACGFAGKSSVRAWIFRHRPTARVQAAATPRTDVRRARRPQRQSLPMSLSQRRLCWLW